MLQWCNKVVPLFISVPPTWSSWRTLCLVEVSSTGLLPTVQWHPAPAPPIVLQTSVTSSPACDVMLAGCERNFLGDKENVTSLHLSEVWENFRNFRKVYIILMFLNFPKAGGLKSNQKWNSRCDIRILDVIQSWAMSSSVITKPYPPTVNSSGWPCENAYLTLQYQLS